MKHIAVATVARSDFGIYLPVLEALHNVGVRTTLVIGGAHMDPKSGATVEEIHESGYSDCKVVPMLMAGDKPIDVAYFMAQGVSGFAQAYQELKPDLILALGDRTEMLAAVMAALPLTIPVAHIHGGEITEGAIDDACRHAITKLSHLHFVSTTDYGRRVRQLGEEPWRVVVSGAPALDKIETFVPVARSVLEEQLRIDLSIDPMILTFHPVTMEPGHASDQIEEVLSACRQFSGPIVATYPNLDAENQSILGQLNYFASSRAHTAVVSSLGRLRYFSLMSYASVMVGNSSSGIIEAASFGLPVVNVGGRQKGRVYAENVLNCECERREISIRIRQALSSEFRVFAKAVVNPYGRGNASEIIAGTLETCPGREVLIRKKFCDWKE